MDDNTFLENMIHTQKNINSGADVRLTIRNGKDSILSVDGVGIVGFDREVGVDYVFETIIKNLDCNIRAEEPEKIKMTDIGLPDCDILLERIKGADNVYPIKH